MKEERRSKTGNVVLGVLLILVGAAFLIGQFLDIDVGSLAWPLFIIVPGAAVYLGALAMPEEQGKGFSALGSIVTMVGLILFYQNSFDHFESWAYAWALVAPTSLGLGWIGYGLVHRNSEMVGEGLSMAGVGLVMFFVAASFFELVIGISGFRLAWADDLWPVLLILLGLLLLARSLWRRGRSQSL